MLFIRLIVFIGRSCVFVFNEDLGQSEIKLGFLKLLVAVRDVSVRREKHEDAAFDVDVQSVDQLAQVLVALVEVFVIKVELEFVALVVSRYDSSKYLGFPDEMLPNELHSEL
jgi:hypothetical protein